MKTPKIIISLVLLLISFQIKAQENLDHAVWDQILLINVSEDGKVDYKGFMRDSAKLYEYFTYLSDNPPATSWSKEETLAYWINAYNAYTIKLIIDNYPLKSIKEIKNPWDRKFFKINGVLHSLNELEHKILRKLGDPRIHFAINCASFSCPIVWNRAFTARNVDNALDTLTGNFINDPLRNTITEDVVEVSKIFSWFKKDFKVDGEDAKAFINKYSKVKIDKQPKKGYKKYNWSLNE
ncbi:DUF547 domain-containing protein [Aquimarina sp. 2201CG14-23]|uniref:DUF547 domain-containing protein n=1 Tax=Aquimarina mycalae TaxID=3040073 RepID=UPI0024781664|nr:DUF547 domain-containing protein [Aquimarina sp. 2201CG14-23]MDH7447952.1 DUF547 domain-containing protein [Aquimarina sp. 2201CG14-23]